MNKNVQSDERYFRTSNLQLASFLYAKGFALANVDKTINPKRALFVFPNSVELEMSVHVFIYAEETSSELLINARKLLSATKQLKSAIYQDIFSE